MVFCLIFHVPFLILLLKGELGNMNSRIVDLLEKLDLERKIYKDNFEIKNIIHDQIDWSSIDEKINELTINSKIFLQNQGI